MAAQDESTARFQATLEATGGTTTGIRVPDHVIEQLGHGKRPRVAATLAERFTYTTSIGSHDGAAFLSVSRATRDAAGLNAGDVVDVAMVIDDTPAQIEVPDDLAEALRAAPDARTFFDGLTDSQRKNFVGSVTSAKTPETRSRRVEQAVTALTEGRKRP